MSQAKDVNEDNIPEKPDRYQKIRFPSLVGFAVTGAKDDEPVAVATRINCKDPFAPEAILHVTQSTLDDLVYPEVINRARYGILPADFKLMKAHVMMYADESKNEVLINDNVRFIANILPEEGKGPASIQEVTHADIQDVLGLYPGTNNDQNAAHVMLMRVRENWYFANFVYNIGMCREKFAQSKAFYQTAQSSANSKLWAPVVDNLYSSVELAIQASLLLTHRGEFSLPQNQRHPSTMVQLSAYSNAGNIDPKYKEHLTNLHNLRMHGRYQWGDPNKKFELEDSEVKSLFNLTEELIDHVDLILRSAENSRNPRMAAREGYLISVGKGRA
jgi:hypothetical protein